jgi:hypothetical protein
MDIGAFPIIKGVPITPQYLKEKPGYWHEIIGSINTAHEESENKSYRLNQTNEKKRRGARAGTELFGGKRCPAWLRLSPDGRGYEFIPNHEKTVRRMIAEAFAGIGAPTTANRLNDEDVDTFDKRHRKKGDGGWYAGSVRNVLKNEALFGRFWPHRWVDGKRVREGEPIDTRPDGTTYFPAIIDEDTFRRLKAVIKGRHMAGGRRGPVYANLFMGLGQCGCPTCNAGLVFDGKSATRANLRCSKSKRRKCDNKVGFPYALFEETMLSLMGIGIQRMIASIIPEAADDERRKLATLETLVADKETRLAELFERFGNHAIAAVRQGAAKQIEELGAEIEADRAALMRLRDRVRVNQFVADDTGFRDRVAEAKARLNAPDEKTRYDARAALAQEFRQLIDAIILREDRSVVVRIKSHGGLNCAEVIIDLDGLRAVRVIDQDGSVLIEFKGAGLAMLEPIAMAAE